MPSAVVRSVSTITSELLPFKSAILHQKHPVHSLATQQLATIHPPDDISKDISVEEFALGPVEVQCDGVVQVREVNVDIHMVFGVHGDSSDAAPNSKEEEGFWHWVRRTWEESDDVGQKRHHEISIKSSPQWEELSPSAQISKVRERWKGNGCLTYCWCKFCHLAWAADQWGRRTCSP